MKNSRAVFLSTLFFLLAVNPAFADLRQQYYNQQGQKLSSELDKCMAMGIKAQYRSERAWPKPAQYILIEKSNYYLISIGSGKCTIDASEPFDREYMDSDFMRHLVVIENGKVVQYSEYEGVVKRNVWERFKRIQ